MNEMARQFISEHVVLHTLPHLRPKLIGDDVEDVGIERQTAGTHPMIQ